MNIRSWRGVEAEYQLLWDEIEDRIFRKETSEVGLCPICHQAPLRFFFYRYAAEGRGGFWLWCPSCLRFDHASCRVPYWWNNPTNVPFQKLEHKPEWLEEHWQQIITESEHDNRPGDSQ